MCRITNSKSVLVVSFEKPKQTKKNMKTAISLLCAYGLRNGVVQELILHLEESWPDDYLRGENRLNTGYLFQRVVKYNYLKIAFMYTFNALYFSLRTCSIRSLERHFT